ncbi:hypothetical protein GCM10012275_36950 [Longimycelium tulufanense]|uniref:Uncharacterized protein n=1 Tax=Longimycelium tulufanense TaxID=907463 RepID=A0A8J3CA07_9PSEU|nr:hypothetical protein [Longimycelium tulufanense]GGM62847.1 hypothetical protein GCM10012275_36950 [Longimycelium tulufanense]
MSTAAHPVTFPALVSRALTGAVAGIAGGIVFGILMAMMGFLPMVAMLVGSESAVVGAIVHLVISAGIGALFGLIVPAAGIGALLGYGAAYGVVWWVLGGLLIMPAWLGMPVFVFNATAWQSLMGHVLYGLVTAATLFGLRRRGHA